jgi:two-component system nitrogen regulation sensor histidine kinase GlnL
LLDNNLLITELNPAAENLLGISRSRAGGRPFLPLVDDDRDFGKILTRTLATNVTYASDLQLARSDVHPEERTIESRVSRILSGEGQKSLLIELIDITRRARISRENALLIQHGAGRQMIRQLAHEIKNPLGGLRGAAQLLGKQLVDAELREYTEVIISEADRLVSLVNTLLGPGGPPNKHPANIHEIIEYVMRLLEPELGERLHVARDYDAGLPTINLDRDQIIQALINLLRNASAALEGHGNLVLRTRAAMNFTIGDVRHRLVATIDIEDDGPGIPADLQDSIFYPLVTSRPEGTGLGLSTAQDLLSRHGGLIEFESRPGRTVFSIHIPVLTEREVGHHG